MKLVECIPNFSEGRDQDKIQAIAAAGQSVPGVTLLDLQSDQTHNRCVLTLVGSPDGMEEACVRMAKKAAELIDMRFHKGAHPRMGAMDVCPFVPAMDMSMDECVELSKRTAKRIWEEVHIPSFLYEDSASRPERRNLAVCRRGEFEGMPAKLLEEDWAPDYGERAIHPTAGITAIGARFPLIAFNVNLDTDNVEIAKSIARSIRASNGGFRSCKAMGLLLEDRNIAQVSMNLVNYEDTSIVMVFEMIRALADRYSVRIIGSELVGLAPAKALLDCAEYYLKLEGFDAKKQIMEYHLIGAGKEE